MFARARECVNSRIVIPPPSTSYFLFFFPCFTSRPEIELLPGCAMVKAKPQTGSISPCDVRLPAGGSAPCPTVGQCHAVTSTYMHRLAALPSFIFIFFLCFPLFYLQPTCAPTCLSLHVHIHTRARASEHILPAFLHVGECTVGWFWVA